MSEIQARQYFFADFQPDYVDKKDLRVMKVAEHKFWCAEKEEDGTQVAYRLLGEENVIWLKKTEWLKKFKKIKQTKVVKARLNASESMEGRYEKAVKPRKTRATRKKVTETKQTLRGGK